MHYEVTAIDRIEADVDIGVSLPISWCRLFFIFYESTRLAKLD